MNVLVIFLSDLHFSSRSDLVNPKIENIIKSVSSYSALKRCIIVFGGDLTKSGTKEEFLVVKEFITILKKKLEDDLNIKNVSIVMVPGNHDLNFNYHTSTERSRVEVNALDVPKNWDKLIDQEKKLFKDFYDLAKEFNNFNDNQIVYSRYIEIDKFIIKFNLLNSAFFSIRERKSNETDKGLHYIPESELIKIELGGLQSDFNITVSHHANSWYVYETEDKLTKLVNRSSHLLFNGHEHIQEISQKFSRNSSAYIVRGGKIGNDNSEFTILLLDTVNKKCTLSNLKYEYERAIYINDFSEDFKANKNPKIFGLLPVDKSFNNWLIKDEKSTKVKDYLDYFVFPDFEVIENTDFEDKKIIGSWEDFLKNIEDKKIVYIESNEVSGKTTLLKNIIRNLDSEKYIIYLNSDDIKNENVKKIIKDKFEIQYSSDPKDYEMFKQFGVENKILLVDNFHRIRVDEYEKLINLFSEHFNQIIITMQTNMIEDEKEMLKKIYQNGHSIRLKLLSFYSKKREELIKKVFEKNCIDSNANNESKINEISKIIESQITFFELSPNFIIMFVESFCSHGYTHTANVKVFSATFIANITNSLARSTKIDIDVAILILQELAFYMHKNKKYPIEYKEYLEIVSNYNREYGKKVAHDKYFQSFIDAKIIEKYGTDELKFVNSNHLSYFVAKEILKQYVADGQYDKVEYLLNNLCFGINSTILLFISYLSESQNLIVQIIQTAEAIITDEIELNFKEKNVPFLNGSFSAEKLTIPSDEETEKLNNKKYEVERDIDEKSRISKIDIYDYNENEISQKINKILRDFKLIEIIARILPNFESSIKVEIKSKLVASIYKYPNKLLYSIFKDLDVDLLVDEITNDLKETGRKVPKKEDLRKAINSYNIALILSIYDHIASISVNKETIEILDVYLNKNMNTNYKIQNLLMHENISNFEYIGRTASEFYESEEDEVVKKMISLIVRKHVLTHDLDLFGKNKKYIDLFFSEKGRKQLMYKKQKLITVK